MNQERSVPTLSTGEQFYTNMPRTGYKTADEKHISLEEYLKRLREKFSSVVVKEVAVDFKGRQVEGDVAIFVQR